MSPADAGPEPPAETGETVRRGISADARSTLMAEATRFLGTSLEQEDILHGLAELVVPHLADWCRIHILDGRRLQPGHPFHSDSERLELVQEMERRYPPDVGPGTVLGEVVDSARPRLFEEIEEQTLHQAARDGEHLRMLLELGLQSAIVAPMIARDEVVGVLTLAAAESGRRYGPADVETAMELAGGAALALDNARLLEAERRARREAEDANRAKSDFLAVVSHELRTPLNAIIGYEDLLESGISGPVTGKQVTQLRRVREAAEHLLSLIEELISLSRLEAGRTRLEWRTVDAEELVAETVRAVRAEAEAAGLILRMEAPEGQVTLSTDGERLRQVLLNLLLNAIRHTPEGVVMISFERSGGHIAFHVRDTGPGIAERDRERIFEPFTRLRAAPREEEGGSGLGLAVARRFARALGGDVTVQSSEGEGSVFTVQLPSEPPADLV